MTEKRPILKTNSCIGIINRGEPAIRFIRAVKEYNSLHETKLSTVAFYLDVEQDALFVKQADRACSLATVPGFLENQGSAYLNRQLMLDALLMTNCDAVWVGWGFLAEDSEFVSMVESAGLAFLGPSPKAMAVLGDKIEAKNLAEEANVPILAWSKGKIKNIEHARTLTEDIKYPLIFKAANAGGGRGIRAVKTPEELETQFKSAREETIRITGNDVVFMEHMVVNGRHLEVQVLADRCGNVTTFGVRDCSVQRRNQKIIEETPPPHLTPEKIQEIEEAAARLIRIAKYESAGTVEFLYDIDADEYYFMEVNTRLQVEHPITEQVYDVDLVRGQIQVALGEECKPQSLPHGVAIEARLNAEDPMRDFTPSPGKVNVYKIPAGPGIRVDSGIEQGDNIPTLFDSMVAKIIAYAGTRKEALARLTRALNELRIKIEGGTTNRAFLLELLKTNSIREGCIHTRYVEEWLAEQKQDTAKTQWNIALIACAIEQCDANFYENLMNFQQQLGSAGHPTNLARSYGHDVSLNLHGHTYDFLVKCVANNYYHLLIDGHPLCVQYIVRDHESILVHGNRRYSIQMVPRGDVMQCEIDGIPHYLEVESSGIVKAPSPAMVLSVSVENGQTVQKGDLLLTLEAMKMEMIVASPENGVVKNICVREGEQVAAGQPLVSLDMSEQTEETEIEQKPRIDFGELVDHNDWNRMRREFLAVFLGYDHSRKIKKKFEKMLEMQSKNPDLSESLYETFLTAFEIYADTENLFSSEQILAEGFARASNYQDFLKHFYRRKLNREKGLPDQFIDSLERAMKWYLFPGLSVEQRQDYALFHIYKSHANLKWKNELIQAICFVIPEKKLGEKLSNQAADLLDEIACLNQEIPAISDSCIHARYHLHDRLLLEELKIEQRKKVTDLVKSIKAEDEECREKYINSIIDFGHHIVADLLEMALEKNAKKQKLAVELLARRFNRDRRFVTGSSIEGKSPMYHICSEKEDDIYHTLVAVPNGNQDFWQSLNEYLQEAKLKPNPEIIVLMDGEHKNEEEVLVNLPQNGLPVSWCCLGFFKEKEFIYRTFRFVEEEGWCEDRARYSFNPLRYRELRLERLVNFDLKLLYRSELVQLLQGVAHNNPKDTRLFALVEACETHPEIDDEKGIQRLVAFEYAFMEAIHAMRAEQAKRKRRVYWNRIIVNINTPFRTGLKQIREYASKLAGRADNLGLEKFVVYALRHFDGETQEVELLFENISGTQFTLRGRTPSTNPLEPMNQYITKVVRARQRKTVYPDEIIKMITRSGYSGNKNFPRGNFEEYTVVIDPEDEEKQTIVPVDEENRRKGNLIFGIITNYVKSHVNGLRRVIILADSTKDMGSLAEPECRSAIAALDLAEEEDLPVEWIPISAGARIDMDSGTENLDWTARTLRRIIEFTQNGGEINIIVAGINVGAQSYWNAEATMLMHTKGILIMTDAAALLLTGKKALDFAGSVSAETNIDIGGVEKIMGPNGQAQLWAKDLSTAYQILFKHYEYTYVSPGKLFPKRQPTADEIQRNVCDMSYNDILKQGFSKIGDIFSLEHNRDRKKPFDMRQIMNAVIDQDHGYFERWKIMKDAETAIVWEARLGGNAIGLLGVESRPLTRLGTIPNDGPESWTGGTLFPQSSKKIARAINAFSNKLPIVILANLSGFDGSPESLRRCQLEFGAEIGRAVVNFQGPIIFVVVARYHGGAYVVFSRTLNPYLKTVAIKGTFASVIGGAPAAAVVFPRMVAKETYSDTRVVEAQQKLKQDENFTQKDFDEVYQQVYSEKQTALGQRFDQIHSVERAKKVGSIHDIISPDKLRPYLVESLEESVEKYLKDKAKG